MKCLLLAALLALTPNSTSQDEATPEKPVKGVRAVELRIVEIDMSGELSVDRGSSDGLALGDLVLFYDGGGGTVGGVVFELSPRTARVRRNEPGAPFSLGTRGRVYVPRSRQLQRPDRPAPAADVETAPWLVETPAPTAEPTWTPDMPLLAGIAPVHPRERTRTYGGRILTTLDTTVTDTDRTDIFGRAGADLWMENPFGRGGTLHIDIEGNFRSTVVPEGEDESRQRLRTDRLSYLWGGTRFDEERIQVGRFLQSGVPEFGVIDGGEYSFRLENGNRFGASMGWMPEPNLDHQTGDDFQLAAFYHFVLDDSERTVVETGVQKTLHDGDADRDLFFARFRYLPIEGWRTNASIWIDRYGASDPVLGAGLGLTRANLSMSKNEGLRSGQSWTYSHRELPELDRNEYVPVLAEELAEDRLDRLSYNTWRRLKRGRRLHARGSAWMDEDDVGGTIDAGMEWRDVFFDGLSCDVTLFAGQAAYGWDVGLDLSCDWRTGHGRWESGYDVTRRNQEGFDDERNTLYLHRTYLRHYWVYGPGWNLSTYGEGRLAEEELSVSAGLALQRTF